MENTPLWRIYLGICNKIVFKITFFKGVDGLIGHALNIRVEIDIRQNPVEGKLVAIGVALLG